MQLKTINKAIQAALGQQDIYLAFASSALNQRNMFYINSTTAEIYSTTIPWLNRLSLDEWVADAKQRFQAEDAKESRLSTLNRDQLREVAKKAKLAGYSRMNASQLREALAVAV